MLTCVVIVQNCSSNVFQVIFHYFQLNEQFCSEFTVVFAGGAIERVASTRLRNCLLVEKPKIVFLLLSFIGYFSQKVMDYVEILRKNNKKNLLFLLFLKDHTISTKTYYFKEWTTILHYQQHKIYTIFYYLYMSALFIRKLTILHYKHFINIS